MSEIKDYSDEELRQEIRLRDQSIARKSTIKLYSSLKDPDLEGNWECVGCDKTVRDLNYLMVNDELVICFECLDYMGDLIND